MSGVKLVNNDDFMQYLKEINLNDDEENYEIPDYHNMDGGSKILKGIWKKIKNGIESVSGHSNDEHNESKSEDENSGSKSEDENIELNTEDENNKSNSEDENQEDKHDGSNSEDENNKSNSEDENRENEHDGSNSEDENQEDENRENEHSKSNSEDENRENENNKSNSEDENQEDENTEDKTTPFGLSLFGGKVSNTNKQQELALEDLNKVIKTRTYKSKLFRADETRLNFLNDISMTDEYPIGNFKILSIDKEEAETDDIFERTFVNSGTVIYTNGKYFDIKKRVKSTKLRRLEEKTNFDLLTELVQNENPSHSFLSYDLCKADLLCTNYNYIHSINYYLQTPIKNSISNVFNKFAKFIRVYNYYRHHLNFKEYKKPGTIKFNYKVNKIKQKFAIQKIPHEISTMIRNIQINFENIKNLLTFDPKTGFYYYKYKDSEFPVLCKHVYMTLDGENLYSISDQCANKGQCIYCGDSLASLAFDDTTILPKQIAELAFMVMGIFGCGEDQQIFLYLYNFMSSIIDKFVKFDDELFSEKSIAICSLYSYELLRKSGFDGDTLVGYFRRLARNCSEVGWDEAKIVNMLDSGIFGNIADMIDVLKNGLIVSTSEDDLNKIFEAFASKELKEIFANHEMEKFNDIFIQTIYDLAKLDNYVSKFKNIKDNVPKTMLNLFENTAYDTFDIFKSLIQHNCPINSVHVFVKGECKHCGFKSDMSNITEVYNKFSNTFNSVYDMKPVSKFNSNKFEENKVKLDDILKKECKTFEQAVNHIKQVFEFSDKDWQPIYEKFNGIMHQVEDLIKINLIIIDEKPLNLSKNDLIRLLVYIEEKKIDTTALQIFNMLCSSSFIYTPTKKNYQQQKFEKEED